MEKKLLGFIQINAPDGGFLLSNYWRKFQESVGRKTHILDISSENGELVAFANIIEHILPVVGKYFYVPRGPVFGKHELRIKNYEKEIKDFLIKLLNLAKENNTRWIRVEPNSEEELILIKECLPRGVKIKKSAVDVQPREILVLDIVKSEDELLAQMKQKTRYNIRLAEKKGVKVFTSREKKYIDEFLKLVKITSERDKIKSHPESYYRKMFEIILGDMLKLYIAEYEGKAIAANLVLFFGKTATYMHGASDNEFRNIMAPYLLQWRQILDAKAFGCDRYDFGGVKTGDAGRKSWEGITKFKIGFAPETEPSQFPGCWDIVLSPTKFWLYRILRKIKP
jgi:peptidoglycan pentaglycine glycine transferase (the first glycine)